MSHHEGIRDLLAAEVKLDNIPESCSSVYLLPGAYRDQHPCGILHYQANIC